MPFINLNDEQLLNGLNELNLEKANLMDVASSPKNFFLKSGCKNIYEIIIEEANDIVENIFFEYSTIASIAYEKQLKGFSFIWQNEATDEFIDIVGSEIGHIWEVIQKKKITPYFHPDFFLFPSSPRYHLSTKDEITSEADEVFLSLQERYIDATISADNFKKKEFNSFHPVSQSNNIYVNKIIIERSEKELIENSKNINYRQPVESYHSLLHFVYHNEFLKKKDESVLISVPIISNRFDKNNKGYKGLGSYFVFLKIAEPYLSSSSFVREKIVCIEKKITHFVKEFMSNYLFEINKKIAIDLKVQSIKSAKAAIMGRNMSHNIGSHVLYYLKSYLSSHSAIFSSGVLNELPIKLSPDGNNLIFNEDETENRIDTLELELPFLKGLGRFLTYLQERQDFIATIATSNIPSYISANFKDFVIDNFVADKKALRHGRGLKRETNILLDFLIKSENAEVEIKFNGSYLDNKDNIDLGARAIEVDLPGGVLGRQAIYSILENIIRNAAKHGSRKSNQKLEIDIRVTDKCEPDYYEVTIVDNNINSGDFAERINLMLNADIVDEKLKLDENHKGIKEIKISTAWLIGKSINEINDINKVVEAKSINGQLGFRFWLYKSRKAAVIGEFSSESINGATNVVYKVFNKDSVIKRISEIQKYSLVIDPQGVLEDYKFCFKRYINQEITREIKGLSDLQAFYFSAYKEYLKRNFSELEANMPLICTDQIEEGAKVEINALDTSLLNFINHEDLKRPMFLKVGDIRHNTKTENKTKRIAFKRHLKNERELHGFFDDKLGMYSGKSYSDRRNNVLNLIREAQENYYSIESITGDNSTIRILFNEEKNDEWILKTIETGVSRILIIDERLWNQNRFYESPKSNETGEKILKWFTSQYEDPNISKIPTNYIEEIGIEENVSYVKNQIENIKRNVNLDDVISGQRKSAWIRFKKHLIKAFSSTQAKYNYKDPISLSLNQISIANIKNNSADESNYNIEFADLFDIKIGSINIESLNFIKSNFAKPHFISVHQGILDKIYNIHSVDYTEEEKSQPNFKKRIIEKLLQEILEGFQPIKLCVHSGRSKPSYIPSDTAFIPFSGIEYGINEAKQILLNLILSSQS